MVTSEQRLEAGEGLSYVDQSRGGKDSHEEVTGS